MKKLITLIFAAAMLAGCSKILGDGKPTVADAQKHFEYLNKKQFDDGMVRVIEFEKVNAVDRKDQYDLIWKGKIEYLKDASIPCCLKDPKLPAGGTIKAGEQRDVQGTYFFFPSEKGYRTRDAYGKYLDY